VNGNSTGKKKRKKRIIIVSVVVGLVLVCAVALYAFSRGGTKIDPTKLAKVEKGDLAKSVVATGKVTPITKVEIKSKASGIVKKLLVEYGDTVKKGQLLAQLVGVATLLGFVLPLTYGLNWLLGRFIQHRVSVDGERQGLDLHELGADAYPEFAVHADEFMQR